MTYQAPDFKSALDMDMAMKGINETELGRMLGLSQQAISKWRHRGYPPLYRVEELIAILGKDGQVAKIDFRNVASRVPKLRLSAPDGVHTNDTVDAESAAGLRPGAVHDTMLMTLLRALPRDLRINIEPDAIDGVKVDYASDKLLMTLVVGNLPDIALPRKAIDLMYANRNTPGRRMAICLVHVAQSGLTGTAMMRSVERLTNKLSALGVEVHALRGDGGMLDLIRDAEGVEIQPTE